LLGELVGFLVPFLPSRVLIEWLGGNNPSYDHPVLAHLNGLTLFGNAFEDLAHMIAKLAYPHFCGHIYVATV